MYLGINNYIFRRNNKMSTIKVMRPANGGRDVYVINDARLKYKNFSGKQGKYPGSRSVNVLIDEEDKNFMESKGLRVNERTNPHTNEVEYTIRINVKMLPGNSPKIVQRTGNSAQATILDEVTVDALDSVSISKANIAWTYGFGTGNPVAYLKEMEVVIVPSIFAPDANDYYMETND